MNFKKMLLMAILVGVGSFYIWKYELGPVEQENKAEIMFPAFLEAAVSSLSVQFAEENYSLSKTDAGDWLIATAKDAPTNPSEVEGILHAISSLQVHNQIQSVTSDLDLKKFGLKEPEAKFSFSQSNENTEIEFGKLHPISRRRYARLAASDTIVLIDESSFQALRRKQIDVRNRKPLKLKAEEIKQIVLTPDEGAEIKLVKEESSWTVNSFGREVVGDEETVSRLTSILSNFTASEVFDEVDREKFGLLVPSVRMEVISDSKSLKIELGNLKDDTQQRFLHIEGDDRVYQFQNALLSLAKQKYWYYRDKTPFDSFKPDDIRSVVIRDLSDPTKEFSLIRVDNEDFGKVWVATDGTKSQHVAEKDLALSWLDTLIGARVLSYEAPKGRLGELKGTAFDIFLVPQEGQVSTYHLAVYGALTSDQDTEENPDAPRFAVVRDGASNDRQGAIISSALWKELDRDMTYFIPKKEEVPAE